MTQESFMPRLPFSALIIALTLAGMATAAAAQSAPATGPGVPSTQVPVPVLVGPQQLWPRYHGPPVGAGSQAPVPPPHATLGRVPLAPIPQGVFVNGVFVPPESFARVGIPPQSVAPGHYWYDPALGAWGHVGQGVQGFIESGLVVGGVLRADASHGRTGVFINGRQLPDSDIIALRSIDVYPAPGRYWCRADGDCGREGFSNPLLNFWLKQSRSQCEGSVFFCTL